MLRRIRSPDNTLNLEFFIARRTARGAGGRRGVMVRIATFSVALSVAVMILSLAVIMGFKREVTRRVVGFMTHAQITDVRSAEAVTSEPVRRTEALESLLHGAGGVVALWPYAVKEGIVRTPEAVQGMLLKGVDGAYDWTFFRDFLVGGELPRVGDSIRTKEVLISRLAAGKLMLGVGDKIEMLFIGEDETPRRDRFKISGIYASGMDELDGAVMMTDLRNVQRLADWTPEEVTGYEVTFNDFDRIDELTGELSRELLFAESDEAQNLVVRSVRELYPSVFDWLRAHDVNAAVVIVIMLVVAFFNMATALLILVLERTRMIGLLKAMGMRDRAVQRIFLWRAAFITGRGLVWGNLAGLGLCLIQYHFHIVKLSSEGYLLSEVPISFGWGWWLALNVGAAAAIVILLALPARVASTVKPSETIRYE